MPRQTRQQIDDEIIDSAAMLFARHGFTETSVQRIADAVGYSKSGLLRHYHSKSALQLAVMDRCLTDVRSIVAGVAGQATGPGRDRAALTGVAQLALRRPGFVALIVSTLLHPPAEREHAVLRPIIETLMQAFAVTADTELVRTARVIGALGALAVARLALVERLTSDTLGHLIDISYDALGHPRPPAHHHEQERFA